MNLDVTKLPREGYYGQDRSQNLSYIVRSSRLPVEAWASEKVVKQNASFGFALARPDNFSHWDDPYKFVWFVAGWGPDMERYAANAVRKLRATMRTKQDTLSLRLNAPGLFDSPVESQDKNGSFPWGDYPWGGGTLVRIGNLVLPCAVSALNEVEDDAVAKAIGGLVGATILKHDYPQTLG